MSRQSSRSLHAKGYNPEFDALDEFNQQNQHEPRRGNNADSYANRNQNTNNENIRLYITIRKSALSEEEYKKLIIMVPVNIKISLLKRQIEKEFADLFPKEPTFICGKVEDKYGYALSNSSYIYEMLRSQDRIYAYQDDIVNSFNHPSGERDGIPGINTTGDPSEILYLLKNVQQSLCRKLADGNIQNYEQIDEILMNMTPLGFSPSRIIVHNIAVILMKLFSTERLYVLEGRENAKILNLLVTLLNYWIGELISNDNFLLSHVLNILETLLKSATFAESFKGAYVIANLMNASNLDIVSSQTKSRLIKIITYLSKGAFANTYQPDQNPYIPPAIERNDRNDRSRLDESRNYIEPLTRNESYAKNFPSDRRKQEVHKSVEFQKLPKEEDAKPVRYEPAFNINNNNKLDTMPKSSLKNRGPIATMEDAYNAFADDAIRGGDNGNRVRPDNRLYKDYIALLTLGNTKEMHVFAVQNLDVLIEKVINDIMETREDYLQLLNLVEIELPAQYEKAQAKILNAIDATLGERRAAEGLTKNIVTRILKALSYQPPSLHTILMSLLQSHLVKGKYRIDVTTVINIILSPYSRLYDFAIKALSIMSDPSISDNINYEIQFENHMKFIIELTLSKNKNTDFKNLALKTLANLSLKDGLKAQIIYNKGIETLLFHLRNEANLEGQRLASKALLNLSTSSRDTKIRIITDIADEVRRLHKGDMDPIIQGYLQTLINSSR